MTSLQLITYTVTLFPERSHSKVGELGLQHVNLGHNSTDKRVKMHYQQESPWWSFIIVVIATVKTRKRLGGGVVTSSLQQGSSQPCTLGRADGGGWAPARHPAV